MTADKDGVEDVARAIHECRSSVPWEVTINQDIAYRDARAAIAAMPRPTPAQEQGWRGEPFGYFVEHKLAEPAFLRKPSYIPEGDNYTVTPLYLGAPVWQPISTHPCDRKKMHAVTKFGLVTEIWANPELDQTLYLWWFRLPSTPTEGAQ